MNKSLLFLIFIPYFLLSCKQKQKNDGEWEKPVSKIVADGDIVHYQNLIHHYQLDFPSHLHVSTHDSGYLAISTSEGGYGNELSIDLMVSTGPLTDSNPLTVPSYQEIRITYQPARSHCGLKLPATYKKTIDSVEFLVNESVKCGEEVRYDMGYPRFEYRLDFKTQSPKPLYAGLVITTLHFSTPSGKDKERIDYWKNQTFKSADTFRWE